jgi:troponin T, fast skeletal muscle
MSDGKLSNVIKAKEDLLKSPEQLEQEKREILKSRIIELRLDGQVKSGLVEQAEKFYQILLNLHSQIYDMSERQDKQKYEMMELAERARQLDKGNVKSRKVNIVHTGLGGSVLPTQELFPKAPQKISLFSRYERVTDRRTFKDRRDFFAIKKTEENFVPFKPKAKLKEAPVKQAPRKTRSKRLIEEDEKKAQDIPEQREEEPVEEQTEQNESEEKVPSEDENNGQEPNVDEEQTEEQLEEQQAEEVEAEE